MDNVKRVKILIILLATTFMNFGAFAFDADKVKKLKWKDLDVLWLEDDRFPTYSFSVYFADGALSDPSGAKGLTNAMISLLDRGTRRFGYKDITDNLEFYGASYGGKVTHEFTTYTVSGLVKDSIPTMKKICHLFDDASYPKKELKKALNLRKTQLKNMVSSHGPLATRAFREISLRGTPYNYPVDGKLKDIKRMTRKRLLSHLKYFNSKVKKRIYITGPKDVLKLEKVIIDDCKWKGEARFQREKMVFKKKAKLSKIILVTVPKSNQAQVRIGRFLPKKEIKRRELLNLVSDFIGGGFTGELMRELRVKRGLTYGVNAFAGGQKHYGRAGITTFTKNKNIVELLNVTKETIVNMGQGKFDNKKFLLKQKGLAGSYPFRFESSEAYLEQLLFLDHIGRDHENLYKFPETILSYQRDDISSSIREAFAWDKMTIVVVGSKSLLKDLKTLGHVVVVDYKKYL